MEKLRIKPEKLDKPSRRMEELQRMEELRNHISTKQNYQHLEQHGSSLGRTVPTVAEYLTFRDIKIILQRSEHVQGSDGERSPSRHTEEKK
ncbi:hypothetical protein P7K49_004624 [Saguinus oedipus]|uniref:Uncharacterized protein n=1 Tax=Saguinus oedipus TaxID=9490 RepID=A0ABQ9W7Y5_SAGOE|nr:hypothetical protein P7K49_004624 [Saguinus oedipus]